MNLLPVTRRLAFLLLGLGVLAWSGRFAQAQTDATLCAMAKVQLSTSATLERQAFVATMGITDGLPSPLTDANDQPVATSSDPNSTTAPFFVRLNTGSAIPTTC